MNLIMFYYTAAVMKCRKVFTVLLFMQRYDEWDHRLFGINEMEASTMDPQQSMVLECVHMALEDGGITRKQLDDTHTGVYIGKTFFLNIKAITPESP